MLSHNQFQRRKKLNYYTLSVPTGVPTTLWAEEHVTTQDGHEQCRKSEGQTDF